MLGTLLIANGELEVQGQERPEYGQQMCLERGILRSRLHKPNHFWQRFERNWLLSVGFHTELRLDILISPAKRTKFILKVYC